MDDRKRDQGNERELKSLPTDLHLVPQPLAWRKDVSASHSRSVSRVGCQEIPEEYHFNTRSGGMSPNVRLHRFSNKVTEWVPLRLSNGPWKPTYTRSLSNLKDPIQARKPTRKSESQCSTTSASRGSTQKLYLFEEIKRGSGRELQAKSKLENQNSRPLLLLLPRLRLQPETLDSAVCPPLLRSQRIRLAL